MGQVNLVLIGQHYINPKGSFTLTSGALADDPIVMGANISTMNGAINGFVKGAAIELRAEYVSMRSVLILLKNLWPIIPISRDTFPSP